MAEMMTPHKKDGRRKIHSLRVDLTPMVDLGFLLISFFMLTTSMAQPKAMPLNMPDNSGTGTTMAFPEEATITLIPVANHRCYYYEGVLHNAADMHSTTTAGVRDILSHKEQQVHALPATYSARAHKLHVLIKPASSAKYDDVVHVLDEMNILAVQFYTIADVTQEELAMTTAAINK